MTKAKKVVVLPSEAAQQLAAYLDMIGPDEYGNYAYNNPYDRDRDFEIDRKRLAKVIQDYWDTLP